jgi:hypothetical protein
MTRLKIKKDLVGTPNDVRFGTPELVANYRAKRLAKLKPDTIIELGAGAGFQSNAFAKTAKKVIAVEIDAARISRAELDKNVTIVTGDALDSAVIEKVQALCEGKVVLFLDPERPASSDRRTLAEIKPDIQKILSVYGKITKEIAIEMPPHLSNDELDRLQKHEREYLSINGVLNRLTLYFGELREETVSAVQLPKEHRIASSILEPIRNVPVLEHHLLEPDMALVKADLVGNALGNLPVSIEDLGNKAFYISTRNTTSPFFKKFKVLAHGNRKLIEKRLFKHGSITLHGRLTAQEQRELQFSLRRFCRGKDKVHLYIGRKWYLVQ